MPRNDTAAFVTTTIQLRRDSLERLERVLVGKRNRYDLRITKRAVFQFLLDQALKDRGSLDKLFVALHDASE